MKERDSEPGILLADRGYGCDAIRQDARDRGATPEIPTKRNLRVQHSVDQRLYALRNRIERFINRLKNSRRVATRYDQTARPRQRLSRSMVAARQRTPMKEQAVLS